METCSNPKIDVLDMIGVYCGKAAWRGVVWGKTWKRRGWENVFVTLSNQTTNRVRRSPYTELYQFSVFEKLGWEGGRAGGGRGVDKGGGSRKNMFVKLTNQMSCKLRGSPSAEFYQSIRCMQGLKSKPLYEDIAYIGS